MFERMFFPLACWESRKGNRECRYDCIIKCGHGRTKQGKDGWIDDVSRNEVLPVVMNGDRTRPTCHHDMSMMTGHVK